MVIYEHLQDVKLRVRNFIESSEARSFLFIQGNTGSGKTQMIQEVIRESVLRNGDNFIFYTHAPIPCTSATVFQAVLSAVYPFYIQKRTQFEVLNMIKHMFKEISSQTNRSPVIVIDDAQDLYTIPDSRYIEGLRQITEDTGAKFIFLSTMSLIDSMPITILRRSQSFNIESA